MARDISVNHSVKIPASEISLSFSRSGGAGGQNVNKVNSKATLRWNLFSSTALNERQKARFLKLYATQITKEGDFIISSSRFRDQPKNIDDCYEKLRSCVLAALKTVKRRVKTKPSAKSKERRLVSKKRRSEKKGWRRKASYT